MNRAHLKISMSWKEKRFKRPGESDKFQQNSKVSSPCAYLRRPGVVQIRTRHSVFFYD